MCLAMVLGLKNGSVLLISDNQASYDFSNPDEYKTVDMGSKIIQLNENSGIVWTSKKIPYIHYMREKLHYLNYTDNPEELKTLSHEFAFWLVKNEDGEIQI